MASGSHGSAAFRASRPGRARRGAVGRRASFRARTGQTATARRAWSRSASGTPPSTDDRVAPVVELDQLGQQLGAHPEAVAGDPVDHELASACRRRRRRRSAVDGRPPSGDPPPGPRQRRRPEARASRSARWWSSHSGAEDAERAQQLADGAVGWRQAPRPASCSRPALDPVEVVALGLAGGEPRRRVGDRPQAEDARPALGGALAGHPVHDPGRRPDAAAVVAEEGDDAAAERGAGVAQRRSGRAARPSLARSASQPPK